MVLKQHYQRVGLHIIPYLKKDGLGRDTLFGSGLGRSPKGHYHEMLERLDGPLVAPDFNWMPFGTPRSLHESAELMADFIDAVGIEGFDWFAHSKGVNEAFVLADDYMQQGGRIIGMNPITPLPGTFEEIVVRKKASPSSPRDWRYRRNQLIWYAAHVELVSRLKDFDWSKVEVNVPVDLFHSDGDYFLLDGQREEILRKSIPNLNLHRLVNSCHSWMIKYPTTAADYLNKLSRGGPQSLVEELEKTGTGDS